MFERAEHHDWQRCQGADEGTGCETAKEYVPGQDRIWVPLVFGVGGVGEELRHPGVMEGEEVVLVFRGGMSRVFAEAEATAPGHARRWFRQHKASSGGREVVDSGMVV